MHLRDGRVLTSPTVVPGGPRIRRLTAEADIVAKYRACADPVLGHELASELLARVQRLEEDPTIEEIMAIAGRRVA